VIEQVQRFVIPAAYALLPAPMASREATAMLLAIGLQESKFKHRKQVGGPARGFWQFEQGGGIAGVLRHHATAPHIRRVLRSQCYDSMTDAPKACHLLVTDNDVIAAAFARLLLWTTPGKLPTKQEREYGWQIYLEGWRPGKPHRETWDAYFASAWQRVEDAERVA
jgi:hypothetical protein